MDRTPEALSLVQKKYMSGFICHHQNTHTHKKQQQQLSLVVFKFLWHELLYYYEKWVICWLIPGYFYITLTGHFCCKICGKMKTNVTEK